MFVLVLAASLVVTAQPEASVSGVLRYAEAGRKRFTNEVSAYRCLLVKRERLSGHLSLHTYIRAAVRREPFSVYATYLKPAGVAGREVLYPVDGKCLLVRVGGKVSPGMTLQLLPEAPLAHSDSNHSITEFGLVALVDRLIAGLREEQDDPTCKVRIFDKAKVNGVDCWHIEVSRQRNRAEWAIVKVFVDKALDVPIYYGAWAERKQKLYLLEEFAFLNIELNPKLPPLTFSMRNPSYGFYLGNAKQRQAVLSGRLP